MAKSKAKEIDSPYIGLLLAEDHMVTRSQSSPQNSEAKGFNFVLEDESQMCCSLDGEPLPTNSLDFSPARKLSASGSSVPASPSWRHEIYEGFMNAGLLFSPTYKIRIGSRLDTVTDRFYCAMARAWSLFLQEQGLGSDVTISWPIVYHSLLASTEPLSPSSLHAHFEACTHATRRYGQKHTLSKLAMTHLEFLDQYREDPQSCLIGHIPSIDFFIQAGLIHPGSDITPATGFPKLPILQVDVQRSISLKIGALVVVCTTLPRSTSTSLFDFSNEISIESFRFARIVGLSSSSYTISLHPIRVDSQLEVPSNNVVPIPSSICAIIGTCASHFLKAQIFDSIKYFNQQALRSSMTLLTQVFKQYPVCTEMISFLNDLISASPSVRSYFEILNTSRTLCKILSVVDPARIVTLPSGLGYLPIPVVSLTDDEIECINEVALNIKKSESQYESLKQQILAAFDCQPVLAITNLASRKMVLQEIQSMTLCKRLRYLTDCYISALSDIERQIQDYISGEAFRHLRDLQLDLTRTKTKDFLVSIGFQFSLLADSVTSASHQTKIMENIRLLEEILDSPVDRYHLLPFVAGLIDLCYQITTPFITTGYDILSLATLLPSQLIRDKDPSVMHFFQSTDEGATTWQMKLFSELEFLIVMKHVDDGFLTATDPMRISTPGTISIYHLVRERLRRYRQELQILVS